MLLLSRGTPMITAGDEFGRTQNGNNNAYAQDNEITWLDWDHADHELTATVGRLVILRKELADILEDKFLTNGNAIWYGADGSPKNWNDSSKRALTLVVTTNARRVAIHVSAAASPVPMAVPASPGHAWKELFSTNDATFNHPHIVSVFEEQPTI
jgi:glycogen operon protein